MAWMGGRWVREVLRDRVKAMEIWKFGNFDKFGKNHEFINLKIWMQEEPTY